MSKVTDAERLRQFWNTRYAEFSLSESGCLDAPDGLNRRMYACKHQALERAIADLGFTDPQWSVLDAGCGQGYFARVYRAEYPSVTYVGLDISERAIAHLRLTIEGAEFHAGNLCDWIDPAGRTFDLIQSFEVLHLILDDEAMTGALANLSRKIAPGGALLVTAALPERTEQRSDYLRYRSRSFWERAIAAVGLRVVSERPIYYWLPSGGPSNKYLRYALTGLGTGALYGIDRAAFALGLPQPPSIGIDSRMHLLTLQRA